MRQNFVIATFDGTLPPCEKVFYLNTYKMNLKTYIYLRLF